jgi:hypothetical protein
LLAIYRLVPTAAGRDGSPAAAFHGEVVVRARSPEDARLVATEADRNSPGGRAGGEPSPFGDDRLYAVVEVPGAAFLRVGPRGLVSGRLRA